MPRITIACPDNLRSDANQLAVILGNSPQEITTFGECIWQDSSGNLYSCASLEVSQQWLDTVQDPLRRPTWDTYAQVDLSAAERAQSRIVAWQGGEQPCPAASTSAITVVIGVDGVEAINLLGVEQIDINTN